jgi:hypothetical protein
MEPEGSLRVHKKPLLGSYHKRDQSSTHPLAYFHSIHFNIILPCTDRSSERSPIQVYKPEFCMHFWFLPHSRYMPRPSDT